MTLLRTARLLIAATASLAFVAQAASASTLYDPGLGLPSAQGWTTAGTPGYTEAVGGGVYTLDTTSSNGVSAGSARFGLAALDTLNGFKLDFNLRIASESHADTERAGFSVLLTGADPSHALELAFWNDRVFAYTALFEHGAEALVNTTADTHYVLAVSNHQYTFSGNGNSLLSGSLVDYSWRGSPYTQPGFLFFGDDTSRARSRSELGRVALAPIPEPSTLSLLAAGLIGLVWWRRRAH